MNEIVITVYDNAIYYFQGLFTIFSHHLTWVAVICGSLGISLMFSDLKLPRILEIPATILQLFGIFMGILVCALALITVMAFFWISIPVYYIFRPYAKFFVSLTKWKK